MIEKVPGEKEYTEREFRAGQLLFDTEHLYEGCQNPWCRETSDVIQVHHVEPKGRVGTYHLVSNCLPLCMGSHLQLHTLARIRTTRIVKDNIVTFLLEKLSDNLQVLEMHEIVIEFIDGTWNRLQ